MKIISSEKFNSKRFTLVVLAFIVLSVMGIWSIPAGMDAVGVAVAGALAAVIMWYVRKESETPSVKPSKEPKTTDSEEPIVSQR